jgi:GntR family transcriptional repressor for pyruvate dehydrogenase complex
MSAGVARPRRQSLTQQCVESMKLHIAGQRLAPGDRLPTEQEWSEMLGVSRLVVREALQVLAGIGLIEIQQGRGTFLRDIAESSLFDQLTFGLDLHSLSYTDVFEARAMLDLTVLELCVLRANEQAIAELEQQLCAMQAAAEAGQPGHDLHRMFHRQMLRAAGNPLIERIGALLLDTFWQIGDTMPTLVYPPMGHSHEDQIANHRSLLEAIKRRDLSQSRLLVAKHLPVQPGVSYRFPLAFLAPMPKHEH